MSESRNSERTPLPPMMLTVVPWFAAMATAVVGAAWVPWLGVMPILIVTGTVCAVTLAWFARRVRG